MRKIFLFSILFLSLVLLLTSMNQSFINRIKQDRYFDHLINYDNTHSSMYHKLFVQSDLWRYGDLYGLSFLGEYKFKLEPFKKFPQKKPYNLYKRNLYVIGDSYLADKELAGAFKGFDNVVFLDDRFPFGPITLDSTKENILIMEFAERNLNDYNFDHSSEIKWTKRDLQTHNNFKASVKEGMPSNLTSSIWDRLGKILFNKDLSRNIELLIFDNSLFTPVKEIKAALNYRLLNYLPKEVVVSTDKKRLLMNSTVDSTNRQSAFRPIKKREFFRLINNLHKAQLYYRSIGFRSVILSIIPNPVSIYDSERMPYNHLLENIEKDNLFPVISVYQTFHSTSENLYYRSDTHWNPKGLNKWINEVNSKILTVIR